jgi:hypothetical protein
MTVFTERPGLTTTRALVATGSSADGSSVIVRNRGTVSIYLGGADVTAANGFELDAGEWQSVDLAQGETLHGLAASGTQTVHVMRTRESV